MELLKRLFTIENIFGYIWTGFALLQEDRQIQMTQIAIAVMYFIANNIMLKIEEVGK